MTGIRGAIPGPGLSLFLVSLLWFALNGLGHVPFFKQADGQIAAVIYTAAILFALILILGLTGFTWAYRWLSSAGFAVAILTVMGAATAVGTFVIQSPGQAMLAEKYPVQTAKFLRMFHAGDIFHSFPFQTFLVLVSGSLLLAAIKRKGWKPIEWGFALAHLGVVVTLVGGLVWSLSGRVKGHVQLYRGQTADSVKVVEKQPGDSVSEGEMREIEKKFGFSVRLDDLEMEHYPQEFRFYISQLEPEGKKKKGMGEKETVLSSHTIKEAMDGWIKVTDELKFHVTKIYRDFEVRNELREVEPGKGRPAVELRVKLEGHEGHEDQAFLLAGVAGKDAASVVGATVKLVMDAPAENPSAAAFDQHTIEFQKDPSSAPETIPVRVGQTYKVAGGEYELTIDAFSPDFVVGGKDAPFGDWKRSDIPRNPALRVSVGKAGAGKPEGKWLFGKKEHAEMHATSTYPKLTYRFTPEREVVIVAGTREVLDYRLGKLIGREPLNVDPVQPLAPGLGAGCVRFLSSAEETSFPADGSDEWKNPYAEIEVETPEGRKPGGFMGAGRPVRVGEDRIVVLGERHDKVKSYRSHVTVLDERGREVLKKTIAVNDSLSYRGYRFYQTGYDEKDESYTVLSVMKDPGLETAYAGFAMLTIGIIYMLYVRPRLVKSRRERRQEGLAE